VSVKQELVGPVPIALIARTRTLNPTSLTKPVSDNLRRVLFDAHALHAPEPILNEYSKPVTFEPLPAAAPHATFATPRADSPAHVRPTTAPGSVAAVALADDLLALAALETATLK
jgi:hypothetical protein